MVVVGRMQPERCIGSYGRILCTEEPSKIDARVESAKVRGILEKEETTQRDVIRFSMDKNIDVVVLAVRDKRLPISRMRKLARLSKTNITENFLDGKKDEDKEDAVIRIQAALLWNPTLPQDIREELAKSRYWQVRAESAYTEIDNKILEKHAHDVDWRVRIAVAHGRVAHGIGATEEILQRLLEDKERLVAQAAGVAQKSIDLAEELRDRPQKPDFVVDEIKKSGSEYPYEWKHNNKSECS